MFKKWTGFASTCDVIFFEDKIYMTSDFQPGPVDDKTSHKSSLLLSSLVS